MDENRLAVWMRAACVWADSQRLELARFGDNMREVAVTAGDKGALMAKGVQV